MKEKNTGFLLIDKPEDWTSHDVVGYLRGVTKIKKIGHAGTLDPFATGLLIVAVSRAATKLIDEFKGLPKIYRATIMLGAVSNTQDKTGTIEKTAKDEIVNNIKKADIEVILKQFLGAQEQLPPMFSAKKVKGKKLYELARQGKEIERKTNTITIHDIVLEDINLPTFTITVSVSTGTYIRTLAHDIGKALKVGAYCKELRRLAIGKFLVSDAILPKEITKDNWNNYIFSDGKQDLR